MLPEVPKSDNFDISLYEFLKKYALSIDQHKVLINYCKEIGIHYLCTPFCYKAAEELINIGLETIKIGSGEMTDIPSLKKMVKNFKMSKFLSKYWSDSKSKCLNPMQEKTTLNVLTREIPGYKEFWQFSGSFRALRIPKDSKN